MGIMPGVASAVQPRYPASKRVFDVLLSLLLLPVALPLIVVIAVLVRIQLGSPAFFRQTRPGMGGQPFAIRKFRTMTDARDASGALLPDADRMTGLGRLLRATSLDELPELWNVLRGEMSWVGPRPLLMQYLERYSRAQARRHNMPPGLTGWAQVNGRNAIEWPERLRLDVWYVDNWSLALDCKILLLTFAQVFYRRGISQPGHATMPEFMGSNHDEPAR